MDFIRLFSMVAAFENTKRKALKNTQYNMTRISATENQTTVSKTINSIMSTIEITIHNTIDKMIPAIPSRTSIIDISDGVRCLLKFFRNSKPFSLGKLSSIAMPL